MWLGLYLILLPLAFGFTLDGKLEGYKPCNGDNTKVIVSSDQEVLELLPDLEGKFSTELHGTEKYLVRVESVSLYALRYYSLDLTAEPKLQSLNPGTLQPVIGEPSKLPLSIPTKQTVFSVARPKFSLYKQLKSPTVYLSLLMLLAALFLPRIVESINSDLAEQARLDAEAEAEAKAEQETEKSTTGPKSANSTAIKPPQEKQSRAKRREALRKAKRG